MCKKFLLLCISFCALAQAQAQQAKHIAGYNITARLLPDQKAISGRETLTWFNDSDIPVAELRFHLYMNAFKNSKSTFMRESGGQLRGDRVRKDAWGWIEVKRMQIVAGADLTKSITFLHPDDDNTDDQTVISVALPVAVAPGKSIQLDIEFFTKFPHVFARTGFHGDFYLGGQWFPKIGVFEHEGMRSVARGAAWNCHQFHANTEFYADYGKYAVDLTVPAAYVVGATGVESGRRENSDKTVTYSFTQDNVHDFAWTAQPTFRKFERMFLADHEVPPLELSETARRLSVTHEEARLTDVKMILLLQPEHAGQAEKHFRAVTAAIKYFGLWYEHYPHPTITVVDPPYGAGGASGMEYPAFITAGTNWLVGANDGTPEEVTVHEFGHQYWQGIVGTNEFEEAWMDEGFNTYSTGKVMDKVYGRRGFPIHLQGLPLTWLMATPTIDSISFDRATYLYAPKADNLARNAWQYENGASYGINSYFRTGLMLNTLERLLGEDVMARVMRTYFQKWRFGHPDAADFIKVVSEVSGRDLRSSFFDQYVFGSNIVDYAVGEVTSERVRTPAGVFGQGDARKTVTVEEAEKQDEKSKNKLFESKVTIRREGEATFPVDVLVRFENGETERKKWDGQYRWVRYEFVKGSEVASVEVDPEHKVLLDANWTNNSRSVKSRPATPAKWISTLLFWMEQVFATAGALV